MGCMPYAIRRLPCSWLLTSGFWLLAAGFSLMTKGARRWLALGVTALALGLIIYLVTRSAEWRDFNWNRVWWALFHAHPGYLAAAVASTCLSYLLRSLRWKYFLEPIKSGSLWGLFVAQVLGFSSIYLVGRVGEVVRPAYIARREHVSFGSQVSILLRWPWCCFLCWPSTWSLSTPRRPKV